MFFLNKTLQSVARKVHGRQGGRDTAVQQPDCPAAVEAGRGAEQGGGMGNQVLLLAGKF